MWVSFWIRNWSGTECCIKMKSVAMANIWCFIFDLCTLEKFNQEILNPKGLFLQYNSLYPIMYKQNAVYKNCFAGLSMRDFLYQRNLATGNSKTNLSNGLCREASRTQGRTKWRNCRLVICIMYRDTWTKQCSDLTQNCFVLGF